MVMARRALRFPFVVTVATTAAGAACSGAVFVDASGDGAGAAGGGGASASSVGSNGGSTSVATAVSSSSGNPIICPAMSPSGYEQCDPAPGVCTYEVACQSGTVSLSFTCVEEGWWEIEPSPCPEPYDSCPGTEYYCDMGWFMPIGTNPPSPCPAMPPPNGDACYTGGMGGVWEHCGYHCALGDPSTPWTVATCTEVDGLYGWTYDGACNDG